jgi:hypothetical protein
MVVVVVVVMAAVPLHLTMLILITEKQITNYYQLQSVTNDSLQTNLFNSRIFKL